MEYIEFIFSNKCLNAAILAWFLAQIIKVLLLLAVHKKFDIKRFVGAGGMPSSHSATVTALSAAVLKIYGFSSPIFAIAAILSIIVMYDAAGVRRAAGEQAKVLNHIMDNWTDKTPEVFEKDLNELLGHTPLQVIAGAILGIIVGTLM